LTAIGVESHTLAEAFNEIPEIGAAPEKKKRSAVFDSVFNLLFRVITLPDTKELFLS